MKPEFKRKRPKRYTKRRVDRKTSRIDLESGRIPYWLSRRNKKTTTWKALTKVVFHAECFCAVPTDQGYQKEPKSYTKLKALVTDILEDQQEETFIGVMDFHARDQQKGPVRAIVEGNLSVGAFFFLLSCSSLTTIVP